MALFSVRHVKKNADSGLGGIEMGAPTPQPLNNISHTNIMLIYIYGELGRWNLKPEFVLILNTIYSK